TYVCLHVRRLLLLVVFQAYGDHRDLHSFPTRRSSDLGVPFLLISADPRSGGMGDIGVVSSADAFSQQWNPAKYAFSLSKQGVGRSEEHTSELQSRENLVCRLLLEKKNGKPHSRGLSGR